MAHYGVPKSIRSDPGTVFMSNSFKNFCQQYHVKHVTCPVRDHRGIGKIERLFRTINERLRTNKNIIVKKDNSGLSEILYALRTGKRKGNHLLKNNMEGNQIPSKVTLSVNH